MAATGFHPILFTPGGGSTAPIQIFELDCAVTITGVVTAPIGTEPAGVLASVSVLAMPVDQFGMPLPGQLPFTIGTVARWTPRGDGTPQRVRLTGYATGFVAPADFYKFKLMPLTPAGVTLGNDDFFVVSIVELDGPSSMFGGGGGPPPEAPPPHDPGDTTDSIRPTS
jgi:hypothetical protein